MSPKWARVWFGATAACVFAGVLMGTLLSAYKPNPLLEKDFPNGVERAFNQFAFFTIQSNLLVGAACLLLAIRLERSSTLFAVLRLTSLVAITVTGIVYHTLLAGLLDLKDWAIIANALVHTVVPIMAVLGWLLAGPRGLFTRKVVWMSLIYPLAWGAFTLIRGAIIGWYPYPFINVNNLGYGRVFFNMAWIAVLMIGLAAGASLIDGLIVRVSRALAAGAHPLQSGAGVPATADGAAVGPSDGARASLPSERAGDGPEAEFAP
jgi:hypothetical protein